MVEPILWSEVMRLLEPIDCPENIVYGVPRGGMIAAGFLKYARRTWNPSEANIILDDIVDSGRTRDRHIVEYPHALFYPLIDKLNDKTYEGKWVQFPWESETGPEDAVVRLLEYVGEDPKREGLKETPSRVVRAYWEMTSGYRTDISKLMSKVFTASYDEMVVLENIRFTSLCEHHLLPFSGSATVAYIPSGKVVGISKLARLVDAFARRLQIQERMTEQIAQAIQEHLQPAGVGVIIRAHHQCMGCRGVKQPSAIMATSCLLGQMKTNPATRAEFMELGRK